MKRKAWFLMMLTSVMLTLMTSLVTATDDRGLRNYDREIRELARRNGYEHGYREGREDRRDRRSFDFRRNRLYREGTAGCRGPFDCNDLYRTVFRRAFENGYREAYYRGWNNPWWRPGRFDRDDCDIFGRPVRRF